MSKILFEDNLAYPLEKEILKFRGKEPFRIYENIKDILKTSLEITGVPIIERKISWDATGVDKSFLVIWTARRGIDTWTRIDVTIKVKGKQNSNTREGHVDISIKPFFRTEVEIGFLARIFWWIYYFIFYKKKRYNDFYMAKNLINKLKREIGNLYGIKVEESI